MSVIAPKLPLTALAALLKVEALAHVALLGVDDQATVATLRETLPEQHLDCAGGDTDWFEAVPDLSRCAVVYVCSGSLTPPQLEQRLAALRDRCRGRLIVEENNAALVLTESHYFALGFRRQAVSEDAEYGVKLYAYSLRDYKTPPDWLNAKYWAHPERWKLKD